MPSSMAQIGSRIFIGRILHWNSNIEAISNIAFVSLQTLRPFLLRGLKVGVRERSLRANQLPSLLSRQCHTHIKTTVELLETQEFEDGSILYKFGNPDEALGKGSSIPDGDEENGQVDCHSNNVAAPKSEQAPIKAHADGFSSVSDAAAQEDNLIFLSSGAMIPHPDKAETGGEDAYFIGDDRWIGVADGVGGWRLRGIDAGYYAQELMENCALLVRQVGDLGKMNPKLLLLKSYSMTNALGSATAVVASIYGQTLKVVNIGDTGFRVFRDGIVAARSTPLQHNFNFPYQIGSTGDDPNLAMVYEVRVNKGDIVILGSDGLFDNLFDHQIADVITDCSRSGGGPDELAISLAKGAHTVGLCQDTLSPFAKEARLYGYSYSGGKMDDITAVVSFVH